MGGGGDGRGRRGKKEERRKDKKQAVRWKRRKELESDYETRSERANLNHPGERRGRREPTNNYYSRRYISEECLQAWPHFAGTYSRYENPGDLGKRLGKKRYCGDQDIY